MKSPWLKAVLLFTSVALCRAEVATVRVVPRETDPAIGTEFNLPHTAYVDRAIVVEHAAQRPADRHELFVFLPGTHGSGRGGAPLCDTAAELGYHAISLTYPTGVAAAEVCRNHEDAHAFELFRTALIEGGSWQQMVVPPADSIESRLRQLLVFLKTRRADEDWGQFLNDDGSLRWERIAIGGHSQGGGHAALIAIKHRVARVVCTGAPKDYSRVLRHPAAWYRHDSATPKDRFFMLNHREDRQGCSYSELLDNAASLKIPGKPVDVSKQPSPYQHSHNLITTYPETNDSGQAHTSVVARKYAERFRVVWVYMLTAER
jgi:pimeloyl-ACP methyl ester carboxylesterase